MTLMPAWDIDLCIEETRRAAGLGLRGINMTSDPQDAGSPDLASRAWDPLWQVCSDLNMPVHFHIGSSNTAMDFFGNYFWASQDEYVKPAIGGAMLFLNSARVVMNTIFSGVFDRYPGSHHGCRRERHRLDPVHPRDHGLRAVRECARSLQGHEARSHPSTSPRIGMPPSGSKRATANCRTSWTSSVTIGSCSRPIFRTRPASIPRRSKVLPRRWAHCVPRRRLGSWETTPASSTACRGRLHCFEASFGRRVALAKACATTFAQNSSRSRRTRGPARTRRATKDFDGVRITPSGPKFTVDASDLQLGESAGAPLTARTTLREGPPVEATAMANGRPQWVSHVSHICPEGGTVRGLPSQHGMQLVTGGNCQSANPSPSRSRTIRIP